LSTLIQTREGGGILSDGKKAGKRVSHFVGVAVPVFSHCSASVRELKLLTTLYSVATLPHNTRLRRQERSEQTDDDEAGLDEGGKRATGE
jgi:hypothetical protein